MPQKCDYHWTTFLLRRDRYHFIILCLKWEDSWNLYLHVIHQQYKILLSPLMTGNHKSSRYCFILGEELSMHTAFGGIAKSKCSVCICIMSLFIAFLRIWSFPFSLTTFYLPLMSIHCTQESEKIPSTLFCSWLLHFESFGCSHSYM